MSAWALLVRPDRDQAGLRRHPDRRQPGTDTQLPVDPSQMRRDGSLANPQTNRDLPRGEPFRGDDQHLTFAVRQLDLDLATPVDPVGDLRDGGGRRAEKYHLAIGGSP